MWANAPLSSLSLTHRPPLILSQPSSSYKLPHPCGMCARAIRFSFSLAPLISVCSRMWAERAASPTLKITTSVERGVCVCECRWAEVVVLGSTHSSQAWDLTAVTVEGGKDGDERYNIFSANPFARKCLLQWMWNPNPSLMRSILAWCRAAKGGDFYFLSYFNQLHSKSTHLRRRTTLYNIMTCRLEIHWSNIVCWDSPSNNH